MLQPSAFCCGTTAGKVGAFRALLPRVAAPPHTAHTPLTGRLVDNCLALGVAHADGGAIQTRVAPRRATGPDVTRLYLGSRGGLGVITTAVMRVHRVPEHVLALAFAFPGLPEAVEGARRVLAAGVRPARLRVLGAELATEELGERSGLCAACLVVLSGPAPRVVREHRLVDELLAAVGGGELAQATASRWWARRSAERTTEAAERRPVVVGTRAAYSRIGEALAAVATSERLHKAQLWVGQFDAHGAHLWLADRNPATDRRRTLASALLDAGLDPLGPGFPPLLEELRARLDPHQTLVVMEG